MTLYLPASGKNHLLDLCFPTLIQRQKLSICHSVDYAHRPPISQHDTHQVEQEHPQGLGEDAIRNRQETFRIFPILAFPFPPPQSQNLVPKDKAYHWEGG